MVLELRNNSIIYANASLYSLVFLTFIAFYSQKKKIHLLLLKQEPSGPEQGKGDVSLDKFNDVGTSLSFHCLNTFHMMFIKQAPFLTPILYIE